MQNMALARRLTAELRGKWFGEYGTACCLTHDNPNLFLSIKEEVGKVLAYCHSGWPQKAVILHMILGSGRLEGWRNHLVRQTVFEDPVNSLARRTNVIVFADEDTELRLLWRLMNYPQNNEMRVEEIHQNLNTQSCLIIIQGVSKERIV